MNQLDKFERDFDKMEESDDAYDTYDAYDAYDVIRKDGYTAIIRQEEYAENPSKMADYLGTLIMDTGSRDVSNSTIGDEQHAIHGEWLQWAKEDGWGDPMDRLRVILPVKFDDYGSSGARIYASKENMQHLPASYTATATFTGRRYRVNSNHNGVYIIRQRELLKEYGVRKLTPEVAEKVWSVLNAQLEEMDAWLQGEVYWYDIIDPMGESVDSCSGFYGDTYIREHIKEQMDYFITEAKEKAAMAALAGV